MAREQVIVYPSKDVEKAKTLFTALLGTGPYADSPYYPRSQPHDRSLSGIVEEQGSGWTVAPPERRGCYAF